MWKNIEDLLNVHMKTLIYLISRIRYLILAVKGQNNRLIKHRYVFCNVTNKQSAPSFSKNSFIDFSIEERLLREITMWKESIKFTHNICFNIQTSR